MASSRHPPPSGESPASTGIGATTGALLIVANMIGVGVFTTTGFMLDAIKSPLAVLAAWLLGGVAALCGALSYAELGAALPRNGGEYYFLSRIYHPAVGFISGWVSLVVGFAAPLAMFSMAFGKYLNRLIPAIDAPAAGLALMAIYAVVHSGHVGTGSRLHNLATLGKGLLIAGFVVAGLYSGELSRLAGPPEASMAGALRSPMFGVELMYVSFAYSGWNTAAYMAGEFRVPTRDIPRSIIAGTAMVAILYLGLNVVILVAAPAAELSAKEEVASIAAVSLFGQRAGDFVTFLITLGLISTVSSNIMAGPRVYEAMGFDYPALKPLTVRRAGGGPIFAIALQTGLAAVLLLTATFSDLLKYVSVTLAMFAAATVLGMIILRLREPGLVRPYRTWGYPVTPILFLAVELWMIAVAIWETPLTAAFSAGTIVLGLLLYAALRPRKCRLDS